MMHYAATHHLFHSKKSVSMNFTYTALLKFSFRTISEAHWRGSVQLSDPTVRYSRRHKGVRCGLSTNITLVFQTDRGCWAR